MRTRQRQLLAFLVLGVWLGLLSRELWAQQPITFQYFYDETGQLTRVVDSTGVVIEYVYDAVGNMLQVNRSTQPNPGGLSIFSFSPQQGGPLATVNIQGQGFSTTAVNNVVRFNGIAANVLSAAATMLVVQVPVGIVTGPISVTVGGSTVASSTNFTAVSLPAITSIFPKAALRNTTITNFQVTGVNLTGATFTFVPAFDPAAVTIGTVNINPAGTSATLSLTIGANASGAFTLLATNAQGSSDSFPSTSNTLSIVSNPEADSDGDGLRDAYEIDLGTDPFNPDTDGDGFSDGVEVASGSDPLNPACTPLNCRVSGEVTSVAFSVVNTVASSSAPKEADSVAFSVLNSIPAISSFHEADSLLFSVVNAAATGSQLKEADSVVFSVQNTAIVAAPSLLQNLTTASPTSTKQNGLAQTRSGSEPSLNS